jgi:fructokinase
VRIGVDLGGTKIEVIALDGDGRELARQRVPTPHDGYAATLAAIVGLVERMERETGQRGTVGVGTPGAISPATGLIKNANSTTLIGHALDRDLADRLGREVRTANDANCFALSEAVDGAGAKARVVFGVILGTGVGGGIVVDGRVLVGPNAIAGEWGHNGMPWPAPNEWPGPACYCGRTGCIEALLSGPALERDFAEATGRHLGAAAIVASAEGQDPEASELLAIYEERLARALASVINVLDPDVIVLGGGMSKTQRLYANVPKLWGRWVFSDRVDTRLLPPVHGDSSGVRGAAWLWGRDGG